MLVISMVMTIPSLVGLACESKEKKTADQAAFHALGGLREGGAEPGASDASFDKMIESSDSPELRKFAEDAKAKANQDADLKEIGAESGTP